MTENRFLAISGIGEYEKDENGFWSLLKSRLRPHRGISQEKLPFYLGFFKFVHNVGKRGKTLPHTSKYQYLQIKAEMRFDDKWVLTTDQSKELIDKLIPSVDD